MGSLGGITILLLVAAGWIGLLLASLLHFIGGRIRKGVVLSLLWLIPVLLVLPLLPAVSNAKEKARRSACSNNLAALGKTMWMYSVDYDAGAFPPNLSSLTNCGANTPKIFICKSSGHAYGELADTDDWTDYVYVSGLTTNDPSKCVMAFCPPENHGGEGANVLFLNSAMQWMRAKDFMAMTNDPAKFFGTDEVNRLAELRARTKLLRATKQIQEWNRDAGMDVRTDEMGRGGNVK